MPSLQPVKKSLLSIHVPLLVTQLLFSTIPVSAKLAFRAFPPESVVFFRITGSALLFGVLFILFFFEPLKKKRHLLFFALYGLVGVVANQYLFVKGVSFTSSINASILVSTIPIFTVIFAVLMKKETADIIKIAGVIIALAGAGILIGFDQLDFSGSVKGNVMILLNSSCFALYLVISKPMLKIYRPFTVITYMYLFSSFEIIPLTLPAVRSVDFGAVPLESWWPLFAIVFLGTFLPYLINKLILQKTLSSVVAVYTYIQPVAGSVLAMVFLGEQLSLKLVIATLLILGGVTLAGFHRLISIPVLFQFKSEFRK